MERATTVFQRFPALDTPRLRLRQIRPADAREMFQFLSDEAVTRYFGIDSFRDPAEARERIRQINVGYQRQRSIRWGITLPEEDKLVGTCGFVYWRKRYYQAGIGYELAHPYWGQGMMTEALTAVIGFGFAQLGLHRIEALVMPANAPSIRLLQRLGFQQEGLLREYGYWRNEFHDLYVFSILEQDWNPAQSNF